MPGKQTSLDERVSIQMSVDGIWRTQKRPSTTHETGCRPSEKFLRSSKTLRVQINLSMMTIKDDN